jgi:hypothetical protein
MRQRSVMVKVPFACRHWRQIAIAEIARSVTAAVS